MGIKDNSWFNPEASQDGNPPDRAYANKMWAWIDKTLSDSSTFVLGDL